MIAMLGMYDRPEVQHANDELWDLIRQNLGYGPENLTRDMDFWEIWQSPEMVFAQTCGLPFRAKLHSSVNLIGTPDYGIEGCEPGFYRSALVTRKDSGTSLDDFEQLTLAYNERLSQSGWAAFWSQVPQGQNPKAQLETGAHVSSAKAVADGQADIAAIDALTWRMIQRYDDFADRLEVIEWTSPTPGLPYITAKSRDPALIHDAAVRAIDALSDASKDALSIRALVEVSKETYLSVPMPPA